MSTPNITQAEIANSEKLIAIKNYFTADALELINHNSFTQKSSNFVVDYSLGGTGSSGLGLQPPPSWSDSIGAFYDSQNSSFDNAAAIANKTTRAMSASGQGLNAQQLAALDANNDGQLSTAEASGVRLWADRQAA